MQNMPKDMAAAWLMIGEIDFASGRWAEAQNELQQYLQAAEKPISPDSVLVKVAIAQQKQDKNSDAIATYGRVMREFPKSEYWAQSAFEHGQLQLQAKDADGARESFAKLVDNAPDSTYVPHALCHLAAGAIEDGKIGEAVEMYRRAASMTKDPELHAQATYNMGMALLSLKRYDEAAQTLNEYLQAHPDRPEAATARAQLAIALARTDKCDEALKQMTTVLSDGGTSLDGQLVSSMLYEQAWCLKKSGKSDDAAQAYRTLLKRPDVDPSLRSHALLELAELDVTAKRNDAAVESLKSVLANETGLTPDVKEQALYRLGMGLRDMGKTAEASDAFAKFVSEFSNSDLATSARFAAGEGYFSLNQPAKAIEFLKPLADANVDKQWRGPALLRLGECAAQVQDWGMSRSAYESYLKAYPDSDLWFHARFGLGWALENTDQYDQAIEQYKAVTDKHQGATAARAQFQMGECLFAQKKMDDALREFLKVDILYNVPEWAAAGLYEAGRCLEQMQKPAEAKAQYAMLVKKYPETKWAKLVTENGSSNGSGGGSGGTNGSAGQN
ncbi:MAG TPA: tetratricopeptide repeat protein, partial [Phycisphaerales bacterium]|nr:tetratricopeptide repeat protein [Phycisphaerales bacterium]